MSDALRLAQHYFDLSNRRDLSGIAALMTDGTTYSSDNTGLHLGAGPIIEMQRAFFDRFATLSWDIDRLEEVKPGIVRFEFRFRGCTIEGQTVDRRGIEHVVVQAGRLRHIEVRNA